MADSKGLRLLGVLSSVCACAGVWGEQETSLIHQDQSIKPQTDSIKERNNYICYENITQHKHNTVSDT